MSSFSAPPIPPSPFSPLVFHQAAFITTRRGQLQWNSSSSIGGQKKQKPCHSSPSQPNSPSCAATIKGQIRAERGWGEGLVSESCLPKHTCWTRVLVPGCYDDRQSHASQRHGCGTEQPLPRNCLGERKEGGKKSVFSTRSQIVGGRKHKLSSLWFPNLKKS